MGLRWLGVLLILMTRPYVAKGETAERPELKLKSIHFGETSHQISGLTGWPQKPLVVSDDEAIIWQVHPKDQGFTLHSLAQLDTLKGAGVYLKGLKTRPEMAKAAKLWDLEGITQCGDIVYVINEGPRDVLVLDLKRRTMSLLSPKGQPYSSLAEGGLNAGYEGIAADCQRHKLYLAKERGPRRILVVDLKTNAWLEDWDIPLSERGGQKVINPWDGKGLIDIGSDFADLDFVDGFLYALERNTFEIAKVDPQTRTVVARVSYWQTEKPLYEHFEPFGLGEALDITPQTIVVGFDNNQEFLSTKVHAQYGKKGQGGTLAVFERPKGF